MTNLKYETKDSHATDASNATFDMKLEIVVRTATLQMRVMRHST